MSFPVTDQCQMFNPTVMRSGSRLFKHPSVKCETFFLTFYFLNNVCIQVCGGVSVWRCQYVEVLVCGSVSVWRCQCVEVLVCRVFCALTGTTKLSLSQISKLNTCRLTDQEIILLEGVKSRKVLCKCLEMYKSVFLGVHLNSGTDTFVCTQLVSERKMFGCMQTPG